MEHKQVKTESGIVEGIFGYDPRILVFKGVPYAAPPVGELRWKAPQPMPQWSGVRMADQYGPMAYQPVLGGNPDDFWTREIHPTGKEFEMSEDCLYVNIFTPARRGDEKLPVLFYIHGGGYKGGYPYEVEFDWEHMARKGIVVVAVTYRLGVMGFLAHPELAEEGESVGNYGLMDQLAAISWTKRNIAGFGGDPDKITIAGQSAGAGSVQNLLSSPASKGLVAGAIIESGVTMEFGDEPMRMSPFTRETAYEFGSQLLEKAGVTSIREARALPAEELVRIEDQEMGGGFHFQPVVDGAFLTESSSQAFIQDHHLGVPVLAGYNAGETELFCQMGADLIAGSYFFGCLQSLHKHPTYLYEFDPYIPGADHPGSYHGCEMWFAYDSLARSWRPFTGAHYDLARKTSSYWVNFVKTGNPNGADTFGNPLPDWPVFTAAYPAIMRFTDEPKVKVAAMDEKLVLRMQKACPELTLQEVDMYPILIPHHGRDLYGILRLPRGKKHVPAVIFSHGYNGSGNDFADMSNYLVKNGCATLCIDFCGGSVRSRSSMSTKDMTLWTEREDLIEAFGFMKTVAEIDPEKIYLFGGSQGGLVSAMAAAELKDAVKGLVLMFPATCIADNWNSRFVNLEDIPLEEDFMGMPLGWKFFETLRSFDTFETLRAYQGPVLITHGDQDGLVPISYSEKLSEIYENVTFHVYEGEGHGYSERGSRRMQEELLAFVQKTMKKA